MNFFASATISALSSLSSTTVERLWRCFVTAVSQFPSQLSAGGAHPDCEVVRLRLLELLVDRLLHQALQHGVVAPPGGQRQVLLVQRLAVVARGDRLALLAVQRDALALVQERVQRGGVVRLEVELGLPGFSPVDGPRS